METGKYTYACNENLYILCKYLSLVKGKTEYVHIIVARYTYSKFIHNSDWRQCINWADVTFGNENIQSSLAVVAIVLSAQQQSVSAV